MDVATLESILSVENAPVSVQTTTFYGSSGFTIKPFKGHPHRNHWDSRSGKKVSYLIMHYTAIPTHATVQTFTKDILDGRVSAHYVITQKEQNLEPAHIMPEAEIIGVVAEKDRAWHAGISSWGCDKNLNATSIGIEHVGPGFTKQNELTACWSPFGFEEDARGKKWYHFDPAQIQKSVQLAKGIIRMYGIHATHVLGHDDIAPRRKLDPGPLFPWGEFANAGVGAWLNPEEQNVHYIQRHFTPATPWPEKLSETFFLQQLKNYGYHVSINHGLKDQGNQSAFKAFKAHFSANMDLAHYMKDELIEKDVLWIWGLNTKYHKNQTR